METKEYIKYLLEHYIELKATLKLLHYELECFEEVPESEIIEALCFARAQEEHMQSNTVSDRTGKIAIVYKEFAKRINKKSKQNILLSLSLIHI